jgi:hypothetical protein
MCQESSCLIWSQLMKSRFTPIALDDYIEKHLRSNPDVKGADIRLDSNTLLPRTERENVVPVAPTFGSSDLRKPGFPASPVLQAKSIQAMTMKSTSSHPPPNTTVNRSGQCQRWASE